MTASLERCTVALLFLGVAASCNTPPADDAIPTGVSAAPDASSKTPAPRASPSAPLSTRGAFDPNADVALCNAFDCVVGIVGPNAQVTLAEPKNANSFVQMFGATPERVATLANAPGIKKLILTLASDADSGVPLAAPSPVTRLTQLEELKASDDAVPDLTRLTPLTHLTKLSLLGPGRRTSLHGLEGLVSLKELDVDVTHVKDLSPLAALPHLETLFLRGGVKSDLTPILRVGTLRNLHLVTFVDTDFAPLAGMPNLETVDVDGSNVRSIAFVAPMTKLRYFVAYDDLGLHDLGPLRGHTELTSLNVDRTAVADLTPLATCLKLNVISLRKTKVKNVAPLASLGHLWTISVSGIHGLDLTPLAKVPELKAVHVSKGQVTDAALAALQAAAPSVKVGIEPF
jgi:hypothetical protein